MEGGGVLALVKVEEALDPVQVGGGRSWRVMTSLKGGSGEVEYEVRVRRHLAPPVPVEDLQWQPKCANTILEYSNPYPST